MNERIKDEKGLGPKKMEAQKEWKSLEEKEIQREGGGSVGGGVEK